MANALRTVFLAANPLPSATQLRWPEKDPGDTADYTLDISRYIEPGDSLQPGFTLNITPASTPALVPELIGYTATTATWWISGGSVASPITDYQCQFSGTTANGLVINRTIWLRVRPLSVNTGYNGAGSAVQIVLQGASNDLVSAYGADPSGTNDCAGALNSAFAALPASGGEIVVPRGDFLVASPIVWTGKPVSVRGAGKGITRLHFTHGGIGFDVAPGALTNRVQFRDFSAFAENTSGPTAAVARVTYATTASWGYVTTVIENVECFGYPNDANGTAPFPQTFARGFVLNGCWSSQVCNVSWFGPPAAAGATSAAMLELCNSNDTRIIAPQAYYGQALVVQTGYCEGVYIINPVVVGCDYAFLQTAQTGWAGYSAGKTSLLGLWIHAGELNTHLGTVQAAALILGSVVGCDVSRDTGPSTAQVMFDFTDVSNFDISGCNFVGGPGGADIAIRYQSTYNSSGNSISGGHWQNMATAVQIVGGNGTVALQAHDLNAASLAAATAILDGSLASNGNRITFRTAATSGQPAGVGSVKDHFFTGPDGSGLLRIKSLVGGQDYLTVLAPSGSGASTTTLSTATLGMTIAPANNLYLSPTAQLWLGAQAGTGAVYSATIGGVTANPGAVNKLWNNGGMVAISAAGAPAPVPAFGAAFTAAQPWGDHAGAAAIFQHNAVPTPPAPLAALTVGDKFKILGQFNFAETFMPNDLWDAWPALQSFLLYAQLMYLAQKGNEFDNLGYRCAVDVLLPAGDYLVSQPLIVPPNVRLGGPGRIVRAPYTTDQSNNGTSSVPGPFATNQFLPTVVVAPMAHLSDLNVCVTSDGVFAHRGSGVCLGKTWGVKVGAACAVGAGGSGFVVGDTLYGANPSPTDYWQWEATVTAVDGSGAITAAVGYKSGAYALPPAALMYNGAPGLQETQWTAANGFSVFDAARPGYFLMGGGTGTGATLLPTWQPDYTSSSTAYGSASEIMGGIQAGRIQIIGAVPATYAAGYGPTFGVMITGGEFEIDSIQVLGGNVGLFSYFATDARISRLNVVEAATGFSIFGSGSIHCPMVILDTCGSLGMIDESHGIHFEGRAFWEPGNLTINVPLINSQTASDGKHYALLIGSGSSAMYPNASLRLKFAVQDMGGLPASTIAAYSGYALGSLPPSQQAATCFIAYTYNSRIELQVTNLSAYGATASMLPTSGLYAIGYAVDPTCLLLGSLDGVPTIDSVAPPASILAVSGSHAWPACHVDVWDGLHSARLGPMQTATIYGAVAPTNGTTGAGYAAPGSEYLNTATGGRRYINTGSLASPAWS